MSDLELLCRKCIEKLLNVTVAACRRLSALLSKPHAFEKF